MPVPATTTLLHKKVRLHFAAILYFLSRLAGLAFVFAVPASYFLRGYAEVPLVAGGAGVVVALFIAYYAAASGLRCPSCKSPVLMDNGHGKHLHARRLPGFNQRARVAWDILFGSSFHCMYCLSKIPCKQRGGSHPVPSGAGAEATFPILRERAPAGVFPPSIFGDGPKNCEPADDGPNPSGSTGINPELDLQAALRPRQMVMFPDHAPALFQETKSPVSSVSDDETGGGTLSPFFIPRKPSQPVPSTPLDPAATPADAPIMNRSPHDSQSAPDSNPFLVAAASMPAPPGPPLPYLPAMPERGAAAGADTSRHEFPAPAPAPGETGGRPPWTLPSLPLATEKAVLPRSVPAAPASPSTPDFSVPPRMPEAPSSAAIVSPSTGSLPESVIKEALGELQNGYRAVETLFQGIIEKLESRLAASSLSFQAPVMPVMPVPPSVTAIQQPAVTHPMPKTAPLPILPPLAPVAPPPVLATQIPPPPVPRRKFARPSEMAAQQLNSELDEVFDNKPAAPAPVAPPSANGPASLPRANGHGSENDLPGQLRHASVPLPPMAAPEPAYPPPSPRGMIPPSPFHIVADGSFPTPATAQLPPAALPGAPESPFAMAASPPATPGGDSQPPAPFTFLHSKGDHFAPIAAQGPAYDPLDDTPLPWMQPIVR